MSATSLLTRHTTPQHIALFGATGNTGLALLKEHLSLPPSPSKPHLTLYTRPSSLSKLTALLPPSSSSSSATEHPTLKLRIVQGPLTNPSMIRTALSPSTSPSTSFPKVTTVISLLGAYPALYPFLTRQTPTPLSDALRDTIIPTMQSLSIRRLLTLSTATAYPVLGEHDTKSWSFTLGSIFVKFIVPQGNAEMKGLGEATLRNQGGVLSGWEGLDATVVRLPFVLDKDGPERDTLAFQGGWESQSKRVSYGSLAKWLLREVEEGKWVGKAPLVINP